MFGMSGEASEAKEPVLFLVRNRRWSKESVEERELLVWGRWGEETGSVVGEVVLSVQHRSGGQAMVGVGPFKLVFNRRVFEGAISGKSATLLSRISTIDQGINRP